MRCGWNFWKKQFCSFGWRMTLSRQAIIEVLSQSKGHLTAEEVYFLVHKKYPSVGLTSVYRTLELLRKLGMVNKIKCPDDNQAKYELVQKKEGVEVKHHHHIICTNCGKVVDYEDFTQKEIKFLKELEEDISKKYNFKIKNHQLYFYGLCRECKK